MTFIQRRPDVFDVDPTLYKCYTNVSCLLGVGTTLWCLDDGTINAGCFCLYTSVVSRVIRGRLGGLTAHLVSFHTRVRADVANTIQTDITTTTGTWTNRARTAATWDLRAAGELERPARAIRVTPPITMLKGSQPLLTY